MPTITRAGASPETEAAPYAVVHLVAQEMFKDLIGPQVLDHMSVQRTLQGAGAPARVVVGFLEAARVAMSAAARSRARELRQRAPSLTIRVLPYVSRFSPRQNAWLVARAIRRAVGNLPVVFHCRTEVAAEWAVALRAHFPGSAVVVDVRGLWAEELLYAQGFDGPDGAPPDARRGYDRAVARLRTALSEANAVLAVSPTMAESLSELGADVERMRCVPCCVETVRFRPHVRERMRRELGLAGKLVFAYAGSITRYQHVDDGVAAFVRAALAAHDGVHLLCLTNEPDRMRRILEEGGVRADAATVLSVGQEDVGDYLSAADAGLLLRAASRMNRVSMPVKLGEYLASGLPVVVSRVAGWVDSIVEDAGAGMVVDWFGAPPERQAAEAARVCARLTSDGEDLRQRALALCRREFVWAAHVPTVRAVYRSALRAAGERPAARLAAGA